MLAVVLALGSSACYGTSNFMGPQLAKRRPLVTVLIVSQVAALIAFAIYVLADFEAPLGFSKTLVAILAGAGNAGILIGLYRAAELGPLSIAAPISALGVVIPVAWGLTSGEELSAVEAVGLVLAFSGAALAARSTTEEKRDYPDPRASILWAFLSAVSFGVFLTALPEAAEDSQSWGLFDARLALVAVLVLWFGRSVATVRLGRDAGLLAVPGLLLVAGSVFYTAAAAEGQLAIVSVLGSLFPVFTVGLSVVVAGERLTVAQSAGVAAALAGVVLIAA